MLTRSNLETRCKGWAESLTDDQKNAAIVSMMLVAIDAEIIRFWDDAKNPYWESCGDALVDGLEPFEREEEDD